MRSPKAAVALLALMLLGLIVDSNALAAARAFKSCKITNGQIFSCGQWYQGNAVVLHEGAYSECKIINGQIFSCGQWFQGNAVVYRDNAYRQCKITNGQVFSCEAWLQGDAVVYTDR